METFPEWIQPNERVASCELDHDEPAGMVRERRDERPKVRDVVQHVMARHHVSWLDLLGDVRPAATDPEHCLAEPLGVAREDAQQLLIAVDCGHRDRPGH